MDYFSFNLPKETGITLSTKCGEKWESHWVPNDTLIEMPYFCSGYTDGRVFFRSIGMQRREGNSSVDSMLHRQSGKPLTVKISANKLEKEINVTNSKFQQMEDKIMNLGDKHDQDKRISIWKKILQWQPIVAGIALVLLTLIILLVIRMTFIMWSAQYSQAHYGPAQYGPADIEEVEMMEVAPEIRYRQPSRPCIRTNPFKQHPAIKNDRIDDRIRELLTHQQEVLRSSYPSRKLRRWPTYR